MTKAEALQIASILALATSVRNGPQAQSPAAATLSPADQAANSEEFENLRVFYQAVVGIDADSVNWAPPASQAPPPEQTQGGRGSKPPTGAALVSLLTAVAAATPTIGPAITAIIAQLQASVSAPVPVPLPVGTSGS